MTKTHKIILAAALLALASTGLAQETVTTTGAATNNEGLAAIGKGLALGLGALGTGVAQARIGSSLVGAAAEDSSKLGQLLLVFLLPETLVIFGFLALFLI
ncbi:V/A-type H+-transporting ATPase subunit K [Deinococcus reticulitermitis]|uniref:V/A-type H+-transporting ATPase subunit K n=1 Tax=Deinococcus reticulitermitis TaxID=856736 RepID=A0A1H6UQQ7_9DEIO|nr:V-type ATP synthase subunit K [Deinococcus reticulitermitis]SEI90232.1 V/A-type H+-transporting ATPase subunit K [Deinococcus reticulitermitis]